MEQHPHPHPPQSFQSPPQPPPPPPPPSVQALHLVAALSNPEGGPADIHVQALRARDAALSASLESYNNLCLQLAYCLLGCDEPQVMLSRIPVTDIEAWRLQDPVTVNRLLQQDGGAGNNSISLWIAFGQMAGLVLKNALLRPPPMTTVIGDNGHAASTATTITSTTMTLQGEHVVHQIQQVLLYALGCRHPALRAVASSIIATLSVSGKQPALHVRQWPSLLPTLIANLQQPQQHGAANVHGNNPFLMHGSMSTIQKIMEDGPTQLEMADLDNLIPVLLHLLSTSSSSSSTTTTTYDESMMIVMALQSLQACVALPILPNSLVMRFNEYLGALSALAATTTSTAHSSLVRQWVCKSIVTMLDLRTEYIASHLPAVAQFIMTATAITTDPSSHDDVNVALAACEFWLTFAHLDESVVTEEMMHVVATLILPQLIPILLQNMVYSQEQQADLMAQNELDACHDNTKNGMKPVFHISRAKQQHQQQHGSAPAQSGSADESDEEGDDNDDDNDYDDEDDDNNEWTLRKCSAASLDSLANLFGPEPILPIIQPCLQAGLSNVHDPWVQEACILALGAIAEGCGEAMHVHMSQLHPYLMNHLLASEQLMSSSSSSGNQQQPNSNATTTTTMMILPQLKSIAAWTISRYASWAIEQVQSGVQGHLLAQMTEVFLTRLGEKNRRVQVAICSAFGILVEAAGDLMAPYLEHVYRALVQDALPRYQGRSLILLFDVLGTVADCCGPSIAEGNLPTIYMPPLLQMFDRIGKNDPTDRTLLPLMECLASIAMASGTNFQPYALECFEIAMCTIESVQLTLATTDGGVIENEEDVDPIVCAADLLDGLVEGMTESFPMLVSSSQRYGQHFLSVLHALCQHEIASVRMSALAIVGDLARNAPTLLEPALPQLLQEAVQCMDPIQPSVCGNAVWAIGEICVRCQGHAQLLEPFAPALLQNLISLLVGNGPGGGGGVDIPGLTENAAACAGRLAKVNPNFVAPELHRFLLGWCDGMAKVVDPTERRDAFEGFIAAVYANPIAIQHATGARSVPDAIASILFAICTWHVPSSNGNGMESSCADDDDQVALLQGAYNFRPFPPTEAALGAALVRLVQDMKVSAGEETWHVVQKSLPVNVRRLLRENYQM
jgi:transportin-1